MDFAIRPATRANCGAWFVAAVLVGGYALVVLFDHGSSQVHKPNPTSPLLSVSARLMFEI
jgi:hypothetical protein